MSQESVLRVGVDSRPAVEGAQRAERALDSLGRKAGRTETQLDQLQGAFNQFRNAMGALAIFEVARQFVQLSDEVTNLQNRLKLATNNTAEAVQVYTELLAVSNETRTAIADNAALFGRLSMATRSMGLTYQEQIELTRQLNQAMVISGSSAASGAAGLLQLSQGLASGVLRGDELNSVLENVPRVAMVIADGLGVPVGALRELGHAGKISAQQVVDAFRVAGPQLAAEFARMQPTIAGAFTVMKNQLLDWIRRVNEASGISAGFARVVLVLSEHFDILAGAVVGVAVALLTSLVPALWAAAAAFMATPLGWITAGLAALGALFAWFGTTSFTAMGQTATGWQWIQAAAKAFFEWIQPMLDWFVGMWEVLGFAIGNFAEKMGVHFTTIGSFVKVAANFVINSWITAFRLITLTWTKFPAVMGGLLAAVVNANITAVENFVNGWQSGLRAVSTLLAFVAPEAAALLNGALDRVTLHLPRMDESGLAAFGTAAAGIVVNQMSQDIVGDMGDAITRNLDTSSAPTNNLLDNSRGGTPAMPTPDAGGDSANRQRETAEEMIARFQRVQAAGIELAQQYYDTAEAQGALNTMEEEYRRKFPEQMAMWNAQKDALRDQIQTRLDAEHAQEIANRILREAIQPGKDYAVTLEQINRLLADHKISADQATHALIEARMAYLETQTSLEAGIELGHLQILADQMDDAGRAASALKAVWDSSYGSAQDLAAQAAALGEIMRVDAEHAAFFAQQLFEVQQRQLELKVQMGDASWADAMLLGISRVMNGYKGLMAGLSNSFGSFFTTITDGFANSIGRAIVYSENLGEALRDVAKQALAELISSLVKMGIQWVISHTIGRSMAAASSAALIAEGAAVAAAWTPAAIAVSIATFGAADAAAIAGMTAAYGAGAALSAMSSVPFAAGGYVSGPGGPTSDSINARLSNGEFVMNAAATRQHRALLEAMNGGRMHNGTGYAAGGYVSAGAPAGPQLHVSVHNESGAQIEVERISETEVRIWARDEAKRVVRTEAPGAVADSMADPNSKVSKAQTRMFNTGRRR